MRFLRKEFFWVGFFILIITGSRWLFLTRTPLFGDEALYCYLGYQIKQTGLAGLKETIYRWHDAPLLPIINSLFLTIPQISPVVACRGAAIIMSGFGAGWLFLLTGWVTHNLRVRWVSLGFYLLNPFSWFTDRTSLMEPVLVAMMLWYLWSSLSVDRQAKVKSKLVIFVSALATLLAKQSAIVALPLPLIFGVFKRKRLAVLKMMLVNVLLAGLVATLLFVFTPLWQTAAVHIDSRFDWMSLWLRIKTNAWLVVNWGKQYFGWLMLPALVFGSLEIIKQKRWELLLIVGGLIGVFLATGLRLFPRYFLIVMPFLAMVVGFAARRWWGAVVTVILLITFVARDIPILLKPEEAAIAKEDHYQFFTDWSSGMGMKAALDYLKLQSLANAAILVPTDLQGLYIISQLTYAPQLRITPKFYQPGTDALPLAQELFAEDKTVLLLTSSHHQQMVVSVHQRFDASLLFASNADQRNSVWIEKLLN